MATNTRIAVLSFVTLVALLGWGGVNTACGADFQFEVKTVTSSTSGTYCSGYLYGFPWQWGEADMIEDVWVQWSWDGQQWQDDWFTGWDYHINRYGDVVYDQIDWSAKWTKKFSSRLGAGMYGFSGQQWIPSDWESSSGLIGKVQNGTPAVGVGSQRFNPIFARAEATYALESFPFFTGEFPITVGGEYAVNPAASDRPFLGKKYKGAANEAYNFGVTFGSAKAKGNWQAGYEYKTIETAAVWRGLNDDDFGFNGKGGTDARGHIFNTSYHAFEPLFLNFRCFLTEQINNTPAKLNKQLRVQVDAVLTF